MKKSKQFLWLALILLFVILQFFPIEKTNPSFQPEDDFIAIENPPAEIATIMKNACYDCHSYQTEYPWYTNIQPVGWWINGHYTHAREKLNFSLWQQYNEEDKPKGLAEMADQVEATKMPLLTYWIMHPEAKLSEEERTNLVAYFRERSK